MPKNNFDYKAARVELDELLTWFEGGDVAVDEAIAKYQRAEVLVRELESYLSETHAKIELLTKKAQKGE